MTGQPDFRSGRERIEDMNRRAYRRGVWVGIGAALLGRLIIDLAGKALS